MFDATIRGASVALSLGAAGCAASEPAGPLEPVEVRVDRLYPTIESMEEVLVTAKIVLTNPRATAATLTAIDYTLTPESELEPVSGRIEVAQPLEAGQALSTEIEEAVSLPLGEEGYLELVRRNTLPIQLSGVARFGDGSTSEFSKNGAIAFPNVPELVVYESQAASYEEQGVDVTFYLRLTNENPFGTVVDRATYEVYLDGKKVSEGTAGIGIRLPQGSVQEYEVNTSIDESTFGDDYARYLDVESFPYEVKGQVVVSGMELPFSHRGTIEP